MFRFLRLSRNSDGAAAVALVDVATPRPRLARPAKTAKPRRDRRARTAIVRLPDDAGMLGRNSFDPFIGRRI